MSAVTSIAPFNRIRILADAAGRASRIGMLMAGCVVGFQAGSSAAYANESSAQLGIGGLVLVQNSGIVTKSEDLRISAKSVDIDYVFENDGTADETTLVAFPLPKRSGSDEDFGANLPRENDPLDFVGFQIVVDGAKIQPKVEQRASVLGIDITDRLKADGIPINPNVHAGGRTALAKLPSDKRDFYIQHGLAAWSEGQPISVQWDVTTTFYWLQTFPLKKPVHIHHSYHPITGSGLLTDMTLANSVEMARLKTDYCADQAFVAGMSKMLAARKAKATDGNGADSLLAETFVDYDLSTGANWSGPIGDFKLTIEKPAADTMMSLCFAGKLQKIAPTTFKFQAQNFTPAHDLSIVFVDSPSAQ